MLDKTTERIQSPWNWLGSPRRFGHRRQFGLSVTPADSQRIAATPKDESQHLVMCSQITPIKGCSLFPTTAAIALKCAANNSERKEKTNE
jgi:hypothetical protein